MVLESALLVYQMNIKMEINALLVLHLVINVLGTAEIVLKFAQIALVIITWMALEFVKHVWQMNIWMESLVILVQVLVIDAHGIVELAWRSAQDAYNIII